MQNASFHSFLTVTYKRHLTSTRVNNSWQKNVVALTGTIGSGKSTALKILKSFGATIISADELAREVVQPGSSALEEIVKTFGPDTLNPDATLNRKALAQIVFTDPAKRKQLEAITHPKIRQLAEQYANNAQDSSELIVYEIPLLFESGMSAKDFKKTVLIKANDEVCLQRIIARDNVTVEEAKKRLASQIPSEIKAKSADIIIDNSGTIDQLQQQLSTLYSTLTSQP